MLREFGFFISIIYMNGSYFFWLKCVIIYNFVFKKKLKGGNLYLFNELLFFMCILKNINFNVYIYLKIFYDLL